MLAFSNSLRSTCERLLALHVVELSTALRSYDAADLIALAHLESFETLGCLMESDCKSFFKENVMSLGRGASVLARWDAPPAIQLSMQFRHAGVEIYYRLTLKAAEAAVEIDFMRFDTAADDDELAMTHVARALGDARLVPIGHDSFGSARI